MTTVTFTADAASYFGAELSGVIYAGDSRYRSNASGEIDTICVPSVSVPDGVTINSAKLTLYVDLAAMDEPNHDISAELVANATCPASGDANNSISSRTYTTASVNWYSTSLGAPGFFDTPDLSAVVQELVDTFSGISGNVLFAFDWSNTGGDLGIATPAADASYTATLTIDYTESGGGTDALTATDIATSAPVVGASALGQTHTLTANVIVSGAPVLDASTITQAHALTATGIITDAPVVGSTTLTQLHTLIANDIATDAPLIDASTLAQLHILTAIDVIAAAPVLGNPTLSETTGNIDALTATDIAAGNPIIAVSTLAQAHALTASNITTLAPLVDVATLAQLHALIASSVTASAPVLGNPAINAKVVFVVTITAARRGVTVAANKRDVTIAASRRGVTITKQE